MRFFTLFLLLAALFGGTNFTTEAKVTTVPFIQLPTGQVLIEADLKGKAAKQYFVIETAGTNLIRRDMTQRLDFLGIDTTSSFAEFPEIQIGDMSFIGKNTFRLKKALGKRSEYAFPPSALGTLGAKFFRKKVLQLNYQTKTLVIADSRDELNISTTTPYVHFTQSFTNPVPVLGVRCAEASDYDVYLDVSLAIGINFPTIAMSAVTQNAGPDEKQTYKLSLDGEKNIHYTAIESPTVYLDSKITLSQVEITFTDELMPAIGNTFLANFICTIDFNDGILFLEPITDKGKEMLTNNEVKPLKQKKKK